MRIVPELPPEQQGRFEIISALARKTAERLPRPLPKYLQPAQTIIIEVKKESGSFL
jgi:hypothetical protein